MKLKFRVFTLTEKMHKIGLVNILSSVNEFESAVADVAASLHLSLRGCGRRGVTVRRAVSSSHSHFSSDLVHRPSLRPPLRQS